jgi:hypothetical protein
MVDVNMNSSLQIPPGLWPINPQFLVFLGVIGVEVVEIGQRSYVLRAKLLEPSEKSPRVRYSSHMAKFWPIHILEPRENGAKHFSWARIVSGGWSIHLFGLNLAGSGNAS